jgi:biotin transport system substrate-specific component
MSTIAIPQPRRVLADFVPSSLATNVALIFSGAMFVGLLAQISIPLSFTPVPVTGQTLGVLLVGPALGGRRAVASLALYVMAGLVGVPWFAHGASGYPSATFGYLLGFVLASYVLGVAAQRGIDRSVLRSVPAMLVAEVVVFAFGVTWLKFALDASVSQAIAWGLTPFLLGEVMKSVIAGLALPVAWRIADRAPRQ